MQTEQLRALAAVVEAGTFEAAARRLGVTPSAVSQRIKALESAVGRVLLTRSVPCAATAAGEPVLRLARQFETLLAECRHELGLDGGDRSVLRIAVNADSLAGWFQSVFTEVAGWSDVDLQLVVEDQDRTLERLRSGDVLAAVTGAAHPLPGCRVSPLGSIRYLPMAAPTLVERFKRGRGIDWPSAPMLRFGPDDALQQRFLDRRGDALAPPVVEVPDAGAYAAAVRAGLGWGLLMESQITEADGLTRLSRDHLDVPLFWHRWRVADPVLARLTGAVRAAAATTLRTR